MRVIVGRNVNDLYAQARSVLQTEGVRNSSRAGDVLALPYPVMSVYEKPTERVLFDASRDANPFFHLMESIWMLAGRDDTAFLDRYVKDFGSRYGELGGRMHGAYGMRWHNHWEWDQIGAVVRRLQCDTHDRRVVIAMWDPDHDLFDPAEIDESTGRPFDEPKDLPCNTHLYPRIVNGRLDLTVLCRSNDIVWGAYGANAVHFSVLQEYLAAAVGVSVGRMYQFSNNWHGYVNVLEKTQQTAYEDPYLDRDQAGVRPTPMVTDAAHFLDDCELFCTDPTSELFNKYSNLWFVDVATPMARAAAAHRSGDIIKSLFYVDKVAAMDWRLAAQRWLQRRVKS